MHALLYESRADERLTDGELEVILIGSRVRNARRGLTGVLVKRGARILQYLEGPADTLERTFGAIAASPLHGDVHVLARAEGVERVFDRWHMGFCDAQSRADRTDATQAFIDARPTGAAVAANPVLAQLFAQWDALTADSAA